MKRFMLSAFFCLAAYLVQAQQTWLHGTITGEHQQALPYVSIGIPGTATGTVSGPDGTFRLLLTAPPKPTDSVRISYIGYRTLNLPLTKMVGKTPEKLSIALTPAPTQLATVEVRPTRIRRKTFGSRRENTVIKTNLAISSQPFQNLGAAIGKPVNLKGKPHFLKQLNLFVAYNTFDTVVFRVQVNRLVNGEPGESLLKENVFWTLVKHRKGWAALDLEPYNWVFNEKVLVSLEWVGHSKAGKYFGLPLAMPIPGATHYYKFGSQNTWTVYPTMSTSINLVTEIAD